MDETIMDHMAPHYSGMDVLPIDEENKLSLCENKIKWVYRASIDEHEL